MKKLILASYTALFLVFFLGSCSVDKRLYRPGYTVSWNHHSKQNSTVPAASETAAGVQQDVKPDTAALAETGRADMPEIAAPGPELPATASADEAPVVIEKQTTEKEKGIISRIIKDDMPEDLARINAGSKAAAFKSGFKKGLKLLLPDEESHVFHLAIAAFVLGIISLFAYYGAFVLGVLAIIFGAIAIHRIRASGGAYRGNTFAWLGLIFGIIAIATTIVIIRVY